MTQHNPRHNPPPGIIVADTRPRRARTLARLKKGTWAESDIEDWVCDWRRRKGDHPRRQVDLHRMFRVDVVTDTHVYEVKKSLTREAIYTGVGQLTLYKTLLPGSLTPVLVGMRTRHSQGMGRWVTDAGFELIEVELGFLTAWAKGVPA